MLKMRFALRAVNVVNPELKYPQGCLLHAIRAYSTASNQHLALKTLKHDVRNIGIIAHIDAGKTTTTERMLFYAGVTKRLGNVDSGDTMTDFLEAERQRGITIQSAAITFNWNNHQINLIDTPGHADFNFEVVRSLRVLDGAVTILDGVAGVEALTEKVWSLATDMAIPRLIFINKMDRAGAGFSRTVREAITKLSTRVALLNFPVFDGDKLVGIVDVLNQLVVKYLSEDGKSVEVTKCTDTPYDSLAKLARQSLIDQLSDLDEEVFTEFVETDKVSTATLTSSLKRACQTNQIVPVLCGASFRNIGVQPLMDAVVQYLPSPSLASTSTSHQGSSKISKMLAFKVRLDPVRGILVYVRIYEGSLKKNSTVFNTTTQKLEKVARLLRMQADEPVEIDIAHAGDIVVIGGSTNIKTGDTLIAHPTKSNGISALSRVEKATKLLPIPAASPVFVRRISPKGPGDIRQMNTALEILLREDPSLHLGYDDEAGQHLLSGMGELHLEIASDRLVNDLKARVDVGDVMITYKETLALPTNEHCQEERDSHGNITAVKIIILPRSEETLGSELIDNNKVVTSFRHPRIDRDEVTRLSAIGITPVLAQGGGLGNFALFGLEFRIEVHISPDSDSTDLLPSLIRTTASEAINNINNSWQLLEPMMNITVTCPQAHVGTVSTDLSSTRRGMIKSVAESTSPESNAQFQDISSSIWLPVDHTMHMLKQEDFHSNPAQIRASVPLRTMRGYLSHLRSITQGHGTFEMEFSEFSEAPSQCLQSILNE